MQFTDQKQFIDLFNKYYKFLCMIAFYHVDDKSIAEDIVQEFFIDFWEKRRDTPLKSTFEAYAARAVKNQSISWIRSRNTYTKRINRFNDETFDEASEDVQIVDKEGLQLAVLLLIDQLPPERKKILLMSARDGFSNKEIAAKLGISIHTVKSQISKAYASIRSHINPAADFQNELKPGISINDLTILLVLLSTT